uniref:Bestrophin homolog n=1 Tax=Melopsittacus undulatus TaxID=13146 RepID=A0A8V5G913_MELUD
MCIISSNVHGKVERGRILQQTLICYANLSAGLILLSISTRVLKCFPNMDHVVEAGEDLNPRGNGLQCGVRVGVHRRVPVTRRMCWGSL